MCYIKIIVNFKKTAPDPLYSLHLYVDIKVTRPSFFLGGVSSYFEALWYPYLYFYHKSNT